MRALCAGVQDTNALVQRTSLDLLLVGFPMHNTQLIPSDMAQLVTAALSAILRRDMSLNRRLYAWLLGSELNVASLPPDHPFVRQVGELPETPKTSVYFDMYSRDYLIQVCSDKWLVSQRSRRTILLFLLTVKEKMSGTFVLSNCLLMLN